MRIAFLAVACLALAVTAVEAAPAPAPTTTGCTASQAGTPGIRKADGLDGGLFKAPGQSGIRTAQGEGEGGVLKEQKQEYQMATDCH